MGIVLVGRRRAAARAAKRLGLRPLTLLDGTGPGAPERHVWERPFLDADALAAVADELAAHAPRAVVAVTEGALVPAARLRAALGLPGGDLATAIRCRDKVVMKQAAVAAGIACAAFVADTDGLDGAAIVARLGLPLVVKARAASGGRGTHIVRTREEMPAALPAGYMAESFARGTEMSVESLVVDGAPVFVNPTEYFRPGWANILPAALDAAVWRDVRAVNAAAIAALGVDRGVTHMEVFVDDGRVVFGELAGRPPGGHLMELIERAYGFDPWEALLRVALAEPPLVSPTADRTAGVWLFHPGRGRVVSVDGVETARALPGVVDLPFRIAAGDEIPARLGVGQEVGHVTVVGADRDEVAARLEAAHAAVRIVLAT